MPALRVAVIGGGIAGLTAAHAVRRARPDVAVTVFESTRRLGGMLRTTELGGRRVEEGADAFLVRVPEAALLAREAGVGLVHPSTGQAAVWSRGRLRPLPRGTVLGIPADLAALARSEILSPAGLARVPADLLLPGARQLTDVSVGRYVAARMGREVVDRLVDPLLGGVYAGRADDLGLQAVLPRLVPALARHRSLLLAARSLAPTAGDCGPVFGAPEGGTGELADAVARASGAEVRLGATVRELARTPAGWRLTTGSAADPATVEVDAVVLAAPLAAQVRLLRPVLPLAAALLGSVGAASVAVVGLVLELRDGVLPAYSGWLVPAVEGRLTKAVTLSGRKWAHLADRPVLVRASVGRAGEEDDLQVDDEGLVRRVLAELQEAAGVRADLVEARVTRWGGALPQYGVGHLELVRQVLAAVATQPGLAVCGSAYDGVGVPAVIRSARAAATRVLAGLPAGGHWVHG